MITTNCPEIKIKNIPPELQTLPRWVVWKYLDKGGRATKIPYTTTGQPASSTDSTTWATFDEVVRAYEIGGYAGIGYVFSVTDGLCGIDLDHCLRADGTLEPWAAETVERFDSYTEVSPSGKGLKIFIRAKKPGPKSRAEIDKPKGQHVEIYDGARYFTVTGNRWPGTPAVIAERQRELDEIYEAFFGAPPAPPAESSKPPGEPVDQPHWPPMAERVRRCRLYTDKIPGGVEGQNGSASMLQVVCETQRFAVDDPSSWQIAREYAARCTPPWTDDRELKHKFESARAKTVGEYGKRLDETERPASRSSPAAATATAPTAAGKLFAPGDPMPTAIALVEDSYSQNEIPILVNYQGEFLRWRAGSYCTVEADSVRATVYGFVADAKTPGGAPFAPTARKVGDIIDALRAMRFLPATVSPPCWLVGGSGRPSAADCLPFPHGILNLRTGDVMDATPELFCRSALSFDYNPAAPRPALWLNFLSQLWQDDAESIELLQEFFGYCLTADTRQQKALMLIGPKRSGKTTAARILSELVGITNVGNPTLASLGFPFGLAGLIDKTLAIIGDARIGPHTDAGIVAERLLSIIGEDSIAVDRKYLSTVHLKLPTRFLILSNELPRLSDSSGALSGRMLTLILRETFFNREDTELFDKLKTELPGILLWAVEGWKRLGRRGRFVEPATSASARQDLENLSSPISAFIRDCCRLDDALSTEGQELFNRWKDWCSEQGREHSGTSAIFFRDLRAAAPRLQVRRQRDGLRRSKVYDGIGLRVFGDEND